MNLLKKEVKHKKAARDDFSGCPVYPVYKVDDGHVDTGNLATAVSC